MSFEDQNRDHNTLYCVLVISSPARFQGRYKLLRDMIKRLEATPGIEVVLVEHAFGHRPFEVAEQSNLNHVRVRNSSELILKENLINLGVQRLHQTHPDWQYMAWLDADITFLSPTWVEDTIHALQHHKVVQMFENAMDLGPRGEILRHHTKCFGAEYIRQRAWEAKPCDYWLFHTGLAWAIRRDALDAIGGLIDYDVIGSGDWHMAYAMIGRVQEVIPEPLRGTSYERWMLQYQERCERAIQRNLGYVEGTVVHHWHGSKAKRKYETRWLLLDKHKFDPETDLVRDTQGLLTFAGNKPEFQAAMHSYFVGRDEDAVAND